MAAIALIGHALELEHVPVGRAVRHVTRRAPLHERGAVLENERPHLVNMALGALLVLETTETKSFRGLMRVVARRALHDALFETVALVERELGDGRGVTLRAFL